MSNTEQLKGIYGCYDGDELVYVGSSSLPLSELEYNHRNWRQKKYYASYFRTVLEQKGDNWTFKWLQAPLPRSRERIEIEEGTLIRAFTPKYNEDMDPFESSVQHGRCDPV